MRRCRMHPRGGHVFTSRKVVREAGSGRTISDELICSWCTAVPDPQPEWVCRDCGRASWNPNDRIHRYCGACHHYCDDFGGGLPRPSRTAQPTFGGSVEDPQLGRLEPDDFYEEDEPVADVIAAFEAGEPVTIEEVNARYAQLRADPAAWAEIEAERQAEAGVLRDGLDE